MLQGNAGLILLLLIASCMTFTMGFYTYKFARGKTGVKAYAFLMFASTFYAFGYGMELASETLDGIIFWLRIQYIGIPVLPALWIVMTLQYVGLERYLNRKVYLFLFLLPAITYALYYTNDFHHLFYRTVGLSNDSPFPLVSLEKGPWYWVHIGYSYFAFFGGNLLMINKLSKAAPPYRMQVACMSIGSTLPMLGNLVYLMGFTPWGIDLAPIMLALGSPFHAWALTRFRMFDLLPFAHERVFESMGDGVLVLDEHNRIVNFNPAAKEILMDLSTKEVGVTVEKALYKYPGLIEQIERNVAECDIELIGGQQPGCYHSRLSPIVKQNGLHIGKVLVLSDITERVMLHNKLRILATTDELTQIYNRLYFMELTNLELTKAKKMEKAISFILMDVDLFKHINDNYGHEAGDLVLRKIAQLCKAQLGPADVFGRYGGEEFAFCLPDAPLSKGREIAESLRQHISAQIFELGDKEVRVTASFGVAARDKTDESLEFKTLFREADQALYRAKESGRDRVDCSYNS